MKCLSTIAVVISVLIHKLSVLISYLFTYMEILLCSSVIVQAEDLWANLIDAVCTWIDSSSSVRHFPAIAKGDTLERAALTTPKVVNVQLCLPAVFDTLWHR